MNIRQTRPRANGEGTVYKRKSDGRWVASFCEVVNGQRKRRVIYAASSDEAHRELRKALNRIDQGMPGLDSSDTFRAVAETWRRTSMRTSGLSPKSCATYVDVLKLHVYPVLGDVRLRDIKPSHVSEVLVVMLDKGLSRSYAHQAHKAMSKVFQAAITDGLIARNPCRSVTPPRGGHRPKVVPSRDQVVAMIEAAPDARMTAFVAVLAYTGVRISEALSLRWSDLREDTATIQVMSGKGGKSRAVPLTAALSSVLAMWRKEQAAERLRSAWWDTSSDWILSSDVGTQWEAHNARKRFKKIADGVPSEDIQGVCPGATPHSLRHATATLLLEEGVPMKVVAELLGHSSTRITEQTYSHVTARLVAEAGNALDRALGT